MSGQCPPTRDEPTTGDVMRQPFIAGVMATALALMVAVGHSQEPAVAFYPGSIQLPPAGAVNFVQPRAPGSPPLPGAPPHLLVTSQSDQSTTVAYDGRVLTITAPTGRIVRIVSGCTPATEAANAVSCPRTPDSQASVGAQQAGVIFTTAATPSGPSENVSLVQGCNNVTLTWPAGTATGAIAAAVAPAATLTGIWRYDARQGRFLGFAPQAPEVSDLQTVNRLDAVFICVGTAGILTRPTP